MTSLPSNKEVVMVGGGGHARSVYGLLRSCGYRIKGFYDDHFIPEERIGDAVSLGNISEISGADMVVLATGNNRQREKYFCDYNRFILPDNIYHSSVVVFSDCQWGKSNLIFARVVVNTFAQIGSNNILNTGCIIEHEVILGSHNHISVQAVLAGRVRIGNHCFIGAGAVIKDGVSVCDDVIIGAGAVVVSDIINSGTYVGVPAKKIK